MHPSCAWHQSPSQRHTARAGHSEGDRRGVFERNTCRQKHQTPSSVSRFLMAKNHRVCGGQLWGLWVGQAMGTGGGPGHNGRGVPLERCPSGEMSISQGLNIPTAPVPKSVHPGLLRVRSQPLACRPRFSLQHLLWLVATTSSEERAEIHEVFKNQAEPGFKELA